MMVSNDTIKRIWKEAVLASYDGGAEPEVVDPVVFRFARRLEHHISERVRDQVHEDAGRMISAALDRILESAADPYPEESE